MASTTVLRSVRTKTATMADLVHVLMFWAKASRQDSRDIANPEWNQWMLSDELLTAVLDEVSQPWKIAELPSHLLQSLCNSCLDLQLVLPRRLRDSLACRMLALLRLQELSPAVDVLAVLCALDPSYSRLPEPALSRWGFELLMKGKQRPPRHVLNTLLLHVGPNLPTTTCQRLHSLLVSEGLCSSKVNHALLRYLLYLHLCGVPTTLSARLSQVSVQTLCRIQDRVDPKMTAPEALVGTPFVSSLRSLAVRGTPRSSTLEKDVLRALQAMLRRLVPVPSVQLQCNVSNVFVLDMLLQSLEQGDDTGLRGKSMQPETKSRQDPISTVGDTREDQHPAQRPMLKR